MAIDTMHICKDCGKQFLGCKTASYCGVCRKKHVSESAKRRRLCDIGAKARWKRSCLHLCETCQLTYPECPAQDGDIKFGNGIGHDNVLSCRYYKEARK